MNTNDNSPIVLAPSELDYKPKKCPRFFYLEKNKKISPKDFPPPVFSRFDVVQQAYYKDKNTSDLTPELPSGKILKKDEAKIEINGDLITNNNTLDTGDNPIGKGSIETAPGANITAGGNIRADKIILTDTLGEEYYIEYSQWGLFANPCSDIGGCS